MNSPLHSITSSARRGGRRNRQSQCPRGLEVDDQLELRWRLNRQFARLLASQDALDRPCRSLPLLGLIDPDDIRPPAVAKNQKLILVPITATCISPRGSVQISRNPAWIIQLLHSVAVYSEPLSVSISILRL